MTDVAAQPRMTDVAAQPRQESDRLGRSDVEHLLHPLTSQRAHAERGPTVVIAGEGAEITLASGERLIDGTAGLWCVNVGHGRSEIAQAAAAQMERLAYATTFAGFANVPAIELAQRITDLLPGDLDAVMFTSGGSEANETAFKLARYYWRIEGKPEKTIIVAHDRAYHGLSLGATAATGLSAYHRDFPPTGSDFAHFPSPYCYRSPDDHPGDGDCASYHGRHLAELVDRLGPERIAAVIVEPVLGTGGVIVPPKGYLAQVRAICDDRGLLLIADEVITGFGRTGTWFGIQRDGVGPDMLTFAKGVTSGYVPLGGVALNQRVWRRFHEVPDDHPLMHGFTYSGHPVACASALANLDIIEREDLVSAVRAKGQVLDEALDALRDLPAVGEVRSIGLMAGIELVADKSTGRRFDPKVKRAAAVVSAARQHGLVARALLDDIVMLAPPFVITEAQIRRSVAAIGDAISASES